MSGTNWLDLSLSSNRHIRTYVQGFVDISGGNLIVRNNNLFVYGGDSSLNGRLLVSGDSSLNGTLTIGSTLYPTGGINLQNNLNMGGLINQSGTTVQGGVIYQPIVTSDVSAIINASNVYSNNMTLANNVYTIGNASNSVSIGVNKNPVTVSGPLYALYDASINGRLFVTQDVSMSGNVYIGGNVGIGKSPSYPLDVSGTLNVSSNSGVFVSMNNTKYSQYGTASAYPTNRFNTIAAGDGVNALVNGNGGVYVAGQGLTLTGQGVYWGGGTATVPNSFASQIQIDGGRSALAGVNHGQLRFYTANSQRLVIDEAGNVGIGSSTPTYNLDVTGTTRTTGALFVGGDASMNGNLSVGKDMNINGNLSVKQYKTNLTVYTVDYQLMVAQDLSVNGRLFITGDASINNRLFVGGDVSMGRNLYCGTIRSVGTSNFVIGTNTNSNATAITSPDVNMGIYSGTGDGATASTFNLAIGSWFGTGFVDTCSKVCYIYFDHRGGKINATTFNATSDYRIKENVKNLDDNFIVDKLRPVSFYNKIAKRNDIGFIAHEVQEVLPQLVDGEKDGENNQTLNYIGLIGILTKEIQELKKTNTDLQSKLDNVLSRLEKARL